VDYQPLGTRKPRKPAIGVQGVSYVLRHHKRADDGTRTPNLLFLCGWYRRALAGWHRLASGLVRLRKDTHCLRSSSDRWAGKCGGKCGVSASDRLRVSDVHGSEDSFRVRAEPPSGNADEGGVWSVCRVAYVCHRAGWLADSLADSATVSSKWPNGLRNQDSGGSPLVVIACAEMLSGSESRGITRRLWCALPDEAPRCGSSL
jgi:hypothetical protein